VQAGWHQRSARPPSAPPSSLQLERSTLKERFIAKKQAARANIALLKSGLDILKDKELKGLQEEYREIDTEFKAMGLMAEKDSLFEGAEKRAMARGASSCGAAPCCPCRSCCAGRPLAASRCTQRSPHTHSCSPLPQTASTRRAPRTTT
jgi:hypothetical protein